MDCPTFPAASRTTLGTKSARKMRDSGAVPLAISRSGADTVAVQVSSDTAAHLKRHIAQVVALDVNGERRQVLIQKITAHPVNDKILHVDGLEVSDDSQVKVDVPLAPNRTNCPGLKAGGILEIMKRSVTIRCPAKLIPKTVPVDLSTVQIEETVYADKVVLPEGACLVTRPRTALLSVTRTRAMRRDEETPAEGAAEGEKKEGEKKEGEASAAESKKADGAKKK